MSLSVETKQKMKETFKKHFEEDPDFRANVLARLEKAQSGVRGKKRGPLPEETKEKMRATINKRKKELNKIWAKNLKKAHESIKGTKRGPLSEETKAKMKATIQKKKEPIN